MHSREMRALAIAATTTLRRSSNGWVVPSQSGGGNYIVTTGAEATCTCPDHETRRNSCKHILAVQFTIRRESGKNGSYKVTEEVRVRYRQNWPAYNAAQTEEKERFAELLAELCAGVNELPRAATGRPPLPVSLMLFAVIYKVYSRFSARRFNSELREVQRRGIIDHVPSFNSLIRYMGDPRLTPILSDLVVASSLPLKAVETDFAVDSSGFSTSRFVRWFNKKYGRETDNREWIKAHIMCGVSTHIVTAADVDGWWAHDTNFFRPLIERTAANFKMQEVSADKAYSSRANLALAGEMGVTPFIPFKVNAKAPKDNSMWARMYAYYVYDPTLTR